MTITWENKKNECSRNSLRRCQIQPVPPRLTLVDSGGQEQSAVTELGFPDIEPIQRPEEIGRWVNMDVLRRTTALKRIAGHPYPYRI